MISSFWACSCFPFPQLLGADEDQSARAAKGKLQKLPRRGAFGCLAPFRPSPRLLSLCLDVHEVMAP